MKTQILPLLPSGQPQCHLRNTTTQLAGKTTDKGKQQRKLQTYTMDRFSHSCMEFAMGVHSYLPASQPRL